MLPPGKPDDMFDRDVEWMELASFAADDRPGATLGIVSGRRRQGKTFLLRALCEATGGFYFAADEATDGDSLHQIGAALGEHLGLTSGLRFESWHEVFDALLALGNEQPTTVVIDEFPYLARANPSLPSILQNALAPRRAQREGSRSRLLLCGSAMTFMGTLLAGNAPLRGRAGLELVVPTLDYQLAAQFWNVTDPVLAIKVHAIVGGTPAYRREFARDDSPADADDFDGWVQRTVLNRASPLFREARYLLAAETELQDMGLYHSVLAAIADGNTTRGGIAGYIGRKSGDLAHPLNVLMDCGLVYRQPDAFRANRSTYEIAEPLITFYHAVMRPIWSDLAHTRDPARLWERSEPRFTSNVLGPHFEQLCRHWIRYFAPEEITGGFPAAGRARHRERPGQQEDPADRCRGIRGRRRRPRGHLGHRRGEMARDHGPRPSRAATPHPWPADRAGPTRRGNGPTAVLQRRGVHRGTQGRGSSIRRSAPADPRRPLLRHPVTDPAPNIAAASSMPSR